MDVKIKGTIVTDEDKWIYDWFEIEATSPKDITQALKEANGEDITFIVNSGGGDVFAGNEIQYLISQYKGNTVADIVGIAASIATVICCGADKVRATAGAQYMIHNVSGGARGDYHAMDKASQILINANKTISNTYRLKTGMSEKELLKLMDKETWFDAVKAKELGFVDEIIGDEEGVFNKKTLYNCTFANVISDETKEKVRNIIKNPSDATKLVNHSDFIMEKEKIQLERMRGKFV